MFYLVTTLPRLMYYWEAYPVKYPVFSAQTNISSLLSVLHSFNKLEKQTKIPNPCSFSSCHIFKQN